MNNLIINNNKEVNNNPNNQISNNNINNSKFFSKIGNEIIGFKNGIFLNNTKIKINKESSSGYSKIFIFI